MPYFIYKIGENRKLTYLEEHEKYREARDRARTLRGEQAEDDTELVKMIFARNNSEAEKLLKIEREPRPLGEELG